ncbi:MAG: hypothetical protein QMD80_03315 [archaeon]|nr:hypothetical protein [archaeon]
MDKQPLFFKDTRAMGDVLGEAKRLLEETRALEENIKSQRESIDEYREQVEAVRYRQAIKELIGEAVVDVKGIVAGMVEEWNENKIQLEKREEEIAIQQQAILEAEKKIESRIKEFEAEQRERMSNELQTIAQLSENVKEQMEELEKTKNAIDNILAEDEETMRDRLLSKEDVEFLRLNYFSLLQSRLTSKGVVNPLTGEEYGRDNWKIEVRKEGTTAKITRGLIREHVSVGFNIKFIVPEDEEGFIYRKIGKEISDVITGFIQTDESDKNSFNVLTLVSPTGWSEWIIDKVENIRNMNSSVYLVDLSERTLFFNESDKKTKLFAEWFVPISKEEEIEGMVAKLEDEIEGGVSQFRADKVASKYQVPRKTVIGAFHTMVEEGKGEIISPEEGAKDVLLVVR